MAPSNPPQYFRAWMDRPSHDPETGLLTDEFVDGVQQFMNLALNQPQTIEDQGKMSCPCSKCRNCKKKFGRFVLQHLYRDGFMPGYKIWYLHGEDGSMGNYASTSADRIEEPIPEVDENVGMEEMVNEAYRENIPSFFQDGSEGPTLDAQRYFDMVDASTDPLYAGCKEGLSSLYSAYRMMSIKTDWNLSEDCMDAIADYVKDILPEDNLHPGSYYEIQKLVSGLGLSYEMIDVCINNCMIYWREDGDRLKCRFCRQPRFQDTSGRGRVPFKRMWYLPLAERLKRLYKSERTAGPMRWHAEHTFNGEIAHPSDAGAWKHFQSLYPSFAEEPRNVYLGLSTDGFNPFGKHGRKYSLWPVIVTPYNLPPTLCMKREFLFLTILVPGPDHPKRSLDVFLQPLIHELQELWEHGVRTYDISCHQDFTMKVVLMWTISDFPAYGMLSGWTTHGKLSCPYCQDNTNAFQLKHGKKACWFDCHRCFLPADHPYRRSTTLFTKKKKVLHDRPPPELNGDYIMTQFRDFGVMTTAYCGGNGHDHVDGYGQQHNWHKKSIFWDLPYWKDHLLRHNLDVMHIEKNFFDNIINTVLNVQGKTKDNLKSRLDLPGICSRKELHVMENGKGPIPVFRLDGLGKKEFFEWITHHVKFPDGYASNLRNCVDMGEGKFIGLKSHDCHVIMQRLLPFAFEDLLPKNVHRAIAAVGAFFRDLCTRSVTVDGIRNLEEKIPMILCNLEKIFPPSFFDVMEHLPVHLPREVALGGPVQYRWMYPFERYMFHLKKKVKNLSKVEGSIVAQSINQETSNFAVNYFPSKAQSKSRKPGRYDDRGEKPIYPAYVPHMFAQVGRLSGKAKSRRLSSEEQKHLHMYILTNCEEVMPYESIYMDQLRQENPLYTEDELNVLKSSEFDRWLPFYISHWKSNGHQFPTWLEELSSCLTSVAMSYPMYCTRGYAFKIHREMNTRSTSNSGISSHSGDLVYYGVLREILEVHYPGLLDLRCVVFYCDWYDPFTGVRQDEFGVTSVHSRKRLQKYDPFILASQANQVSYIPYPRVRNKQDPWITVTSINPRGRVDGVADTEPLQQSTAGYIGSIDHSLEVDLVVDFTTDAEDAIFEDSEEEIGEFDQESESASSDYLSDSDGL